MSDARSYRGAVTMFAAVMWCLIDLSVAHTQNLTPSSFVFLSNRDAPRRAFDIYVQHHPGGEPLNLTKGVRDAGVTSSSAPRLLRTRETILFFSDGTKSVKELSIATLKVRTLSGLSYESPQFDIAPDEQFLLTTDRVGAKLQLIEINLTTGERINLSNNDHNNTEPRYSPDGRSIAYVSDADGTRSIAIMERSGSHQRILTNNFGDDQQPRFSPDGTSLVFASTRSAKNDDECHLYTIKTDGTGFRLLHDGPATYSSPALIQGGTALLFVASNRLKKTSHIMIKEVSSGSVKDITAELAYFSQNFSLSPDGKSFIFEHMTVVDSEIMFCDLVTRTLSAVTKSKSWDCSPSF